FAKCGENPAGSGATNTRVELPLPLMPSSRIPGELNPDDDGACQCDHAASVSLAHVKPASRSVCVAFAPASTFLRSSGKLGISSVEADAPASRPSSTQ